MRENNIKKLMTEGKPVANAWLSIGNSFTAEIIAMQGYDSVTIDMQHGVIGYDDILPMLQAIATTSATPIIRVPWLSPIEIMKALDAGVMGIICPMISTKEQALELVSYMKYPPLGTRSFGPSRAALANRAEYYKNANHNILCFAMIETQEAFDNVEEIASVEGVDALYIGPADLTLGLTNGALMPGFDRQEPEMLDAIRHILDVAHKAGKKAALHCGDVAYAAKAVEWGFDMVTLMNDIGLLSNAANKSVKNFRDLTN